MNPDRVFRFFNDYLQAESLRTADIDVNTAVLEFLTNEGYTTGSIDDRLQAYGAAHSVYDLPFKIMENISRSHPLPLNVLPSVLAWWDASEGITVTGSGVSSWVDRIKGYDAVQSTDSARPSYSAMGFNGFPGLTFDGTDDRLTLDGVPFPANNFEFWAVIQNDAAAATAGNKFIMNFGTGIGSIQNRRFTSNTMASSIGGSATVAQQTGPFESRHLFHSIFTPTSNSVSIDDSADTVVSNTVNVSGTRCRIGSNTADTAAAFWQGKMRDLVVTSILTTGQRSALTTFLLARRAL